MPIPENAPELTPNQAIVFYERATGEDANNAENFMELGVAYYVSHRWEDALRAFERAVALQSHLAHAHYFLGILYAARGDSARAQQELAAVLQTTDNSMLKAQAQARIPKISSAAQLAG